MRQLFIDALLAPAVEKKNDLHASFLSMHVLTKNLQLRLLNVINLFLHAAALLPKHCSKDRVTPMEQSFIHIYQQING